jgi:hypothetical protein
VPFDARVAYDPARNVLYLNFERLEIKTPQMVDAIGAKVAEVCEPIAAQGLRRGSRGLPCHAARKVGSRGVQKRAIMRPGGRFDQWPVNP